MNTIEKMAKARAAKTNTNNDSIRKSKKVKQYIRKRGGGTVLVELTRSQAIKAFCTECMGHGEAHPKDCSDSLCPLYSFRGKITISY